MQTSVLAKPPLAPPSLSNPMGSEMALQTPAGDMGHINIVQITIGVYKMITAGNINRVRVTSGTI